MNKLVNPPLRYVYSISVEIKQKDENIRTIKDRVDANDSNQAIERFYDKHDIDPKDVVSTRIQRAEDKNHERSSL